MVVSCYMVLGVELVSSVTAPSAFNEETPFQPPNVRKVIIDKKRILQNLSVSFCASDGLAQPRCPLLRVQLLLLLFDQPCSEFVAPILLSAATCVSLCAISARFLIICLLLDVF